MICEAQSAAMASRAKENAGSSERPRVLVSEDQDDVLAALGLLLKNNGYDTEFVKSPAETMKALGSRDFDAVLLDLNYSRDTTSGAEGLELLSKVQALDSTLAVVVMTAWGTIELAVDAMHRGACEFVQKPWDNAHLLRVLNEQMKRSRELREKRLNDQLEQQEAAQIQRAMLPGEIASPDGLTIVACTQSARTVGGDYYDVIRIGEHRSAICIADVMGKGMGAALLMSNLQAAVRMLAPQVEGPRDLCNRVNEVISANSVPGKFITFFYCVVDLEQGRIRYTNAGHNWPILARSNGNCERLNTEDVVLGTLRQWNYHQQEAELCGGDRLVLFTDGITESAGADGAEFGEEYLLGLVSQNVQLPADQLKELILGSARNHSGGVLTDDATLIVAAAR
ncbi:MAG TPA: SpoIIE family protein phosphatase [Candidatus Angelobacter sp.]|nr:SpoIIE family protein phosphatase [Candidatus Angelobacter sp.]